MFQARKLTLALPLPLALLAATAAGDDTKYLDDFEFVARTVARDGAAVAVRGLDWDAIVARHRPCFERCSDDVEHVRNVKRLLAELCDSHTGVTRSSVDSGELPAKWDGLYGGGLWFGWDDGRVMLRGALPGVALADGIGPGAALVSIDGWPAWLALEREKRRIGEYLGSSSDHSLFTSLANRMLPFGEAQALSIGFLPGAGGPARAFDVRRWSPEGKGFSPLAATLPEGVDAAEGAAHGTLALDWCERVGYVRITGAMNDATVAAFHRALDALQGAPALLLDCRGMGGGSDDAAWAMCGRFFPEGVANGLHGRIEASGAFQFEGPVVMLQGELEVSAAETFTWAMSETERCVSVGRPTGGWAIIPRGFKCPSGLVDFRLGVNARPTPIERRATEGVGWAPDVVVPYGPLLCAEDDATRRIGLEVLRVLHAGVERDQAAALFGDLFGARHADAAKRAHRLARDVDGWQPQRLIGLVQDDLAATLALEVALLEDDASVAPDVLGAERRFEALAERAKGAKLNVAKLQAALKGQRAERAAQVALLELEGPTFAADERAQKAFLAKHGKTRLAAFAREVLFAR